MASITVNYNLKDAGYANYASQTIRFTLMGSGAKSSTDYVVAKGFVESTSDANGDGSVTLYRTALSGIANNFYEVLLPGGDRQNIVTPDSSTIELAELLTNHRVSASTPETTGINTASITATTCDLNGGTIDGAVIGGSSAAAGTFTTLTGTSLSTTAISLTDNLSTALDIKEGSNSYLKFTSTNSSEQITFGKNSTFASTTIADLGTVTTADINGGTMDGVTIGGASAAAVTGTTITGANVLSTSTIGYTAGNGGTVTQGSSSGKSTAVTLNKTSGTITTDNASLADDTVVSFTVNNTQVAANDVIILSIKSGATAGAYTYQVSAVASNSFNISIKNTSGGSLGEAIVFNFAVIKAVTS